ncbi:hypothetical protein LSTR_LSTR001639 [Laodelphax striatellus]|uniref:Uncharacterized protein n=1 Tax=Laodelphax striatellus TaxID=195883 RepID=A0A482XD19_LAOST|nr:hypothetical protein LSTR_LSTR001639 [Laodelphax striatellus]
MSDKINLTPNKIRKYFENSDSDSDISADDIPSDYEIKQDTSKLSVNNVEESSEEEVAENFEHLEEGVHIFEIVGDNLQEIQEDEQQNTIEQAIPGDENQPEDIIPDPVPNRNWCRVYPPENVIDISE